MMMSIRDLKRGGGRELRNGRYPFMSIDSGFQWTSWLVPMIVVTNTVMFIVIMFVNDCPNNSSFGGGQCVPKFLGRFSFQPLHENQFFGPSSTTLGKLGALIRISVVYEHQHWRLITNIWLHAGVVHLLSNMTSLILVGIRLEQRLGYVRVGIIYMLSGIGGSILSCLFQQAYNMSVGASGAIYGLVGAMLADLLTNWTIYTNKAAALIAFIVFIGISLAVGLVLPVVDTFAHIGGFLSGLLLGFVLLLRPQFGWLERQHLSAEDRLKSKFTVCQYVLLVVGLILLIVGFSVGSVMMIRGEKGNDHCSWCNYVKCVPSSRWKCDHH